MATRDPDDIDQICDEESTSLSENEECDDSDESNDSGDDGEDGEGDHVARAEKPYNPDSDANSKFPFPKSKRIKLNIEAFYTRLWGGREAFREFYQNWMDGILKANDLKLDQFQLDYHENLKKRRIEITCRHPTTPDPDDPTVKKLLGYILFRWPLKTIVSLKTNTEKAKSVDNIKQEGWVEMCNFKASLYARNFKLGNTTKANDKDQAGEHGEGFKIAAMVLRRHPQNYTVRAMASERFIDFKFNSTGEIAACVSSPKWRKKNKDLARFEELSDKGKPRPLEPKVWDDVTFIIGGDQKEVKDARGRKTLTSRVTLAAFKDWLSITTHINPPKGKIQTPHGTLILDECHRNKMYLRGLLLPNAIGSRDKYMYGYDFPEGRTNRDREGLKSNGQRELMIAKIWSFAICDPEFMKLYCELLLQPQDNRKADVFCAEHYLKEGDIFRIWGFLKVDSRSRNIFYFCDGKDQEDAPLIRKHLDLEPQAMPKDLWEALQKHILINIRTFSQQCERLFLEREEVRIEDNPFSSHMRYLLWACLLAHRSTSDKRFVIVDGGRLGLNSYYDKAERLWKLDKKLFDVSSLRTWVYCDAREDELNDAPENNVFLWDRPVIEVYGLMIDDLNYEELNFNLTDGNNEGVVQEKSVAEFRKEADERKRWLAGMVSGLLTSVPRGVKITATPKGRELEVSWQSAESMAVCNISTSMQMVILHRHSSCYLQTINPLFDADIECACPFQEVALGMQSCVFPDLDDTEKFFPLVSRKMRPAIYGKAPESCFPLPLNDLVEMSMDDFDEPADNLSYNGSMRAPSSAPSTGGPTGTPKRKTPLLSGPGASRLLSQSAEELPDRTHTTEGRGHLPAVPQTYTYKRGNFKLPLDHPQLSHPFSRQWYTATQLGGEQGDAIIGILPSKKRKTPPDDAEDAPVRRSRQATAVSTDNHEYYESSD